MFKKILFLYVHVPMYAKINGLKQMFMDKS